jgi:hypothetical protein
MAKAEESGVLFCAAVGPRYLIDQILETGLEPFRGPEPLPPIRFEEIELVCWLALSPEAERVGGAEA